MNGKTKPAYGKTRSKEAELPFQRDLQPVDLIIIEISLNAL